MRGVLDVVAIRLLDLVTDGTRHTGISPLPLELLLWQRLVLPWIASPSIAAGTTDPQLSLAKFTTVTDEAAKPLMPVLNNCAEAADADNGVRCRKCIERVPWWWYCSYLKLVLTATETELKDETPIRGCFELIQVRENLVLCAVGRTCLAYLQVAIADKIWTVWMEMTKRLVLKL
jgi:hypothetical protein